MGYNQANISLDVVTVDLGSSDVSSRTRPGKGLNCNDPLSPILAPRHPFWDRSADHSDVSPGIPNLEKCTYSFTESRDAYYLSKMLRANISGKYGAFSGSASFEYTKNLIEEGELIFATIVKAEPGDDLREDDLNWSGDDIAKLKSMESIEDDRVRQEFFIRNFGSHYIDYVENGFRFSISGYYRSKVESERLAFRAAFKASFGAGSAAGGIQADQEAMMRSASTGIESQFVSGGLDPDRPPIMSTYDDVRKFLRELADGAVRVKDGPVKATARSYWNTLDAYPAVRRVISTEYSVDIASPYGVPRGTVLPWYPPLEAQADDDIAGLALMIPDGWALADGVQHPLDLRDKFIMSVPIQRLSENGGSDRHFHDLSITLPYNGGCSGGDNHMALPEQLYSFPTSGASSLPPYVGLVFIIKL